MNNNLKSKLAFTVFFLSSILWGNSGLHKISLERCSGSDRLWPDLFDSPPFREGEIHSFSGLHFNVFVSMISNSSSALVPSPIQWDKRYLRGMLLQVSKKTREYLLGVTALGEKVYFRIAGSADDPVLRVQVIKPTAEIKGFFFDAKSHLPRLTQLAEKNLKLNTMTALTKEITRDWSEKLAVFQIEGSGKKNDTEFLLNKDADKSFQSLVNAYQYALRVNPPYSIDHLEEINSLVLGDNALKDARVGKVRRIAQKGHILLVNTPTDIQVGQGAKSKYLEINEAMLYDEDVPDATKHVLDRINNLANPKLTDILMVYRDLMLIHPFRYGDSRTIRALMAAMLLKNGYKPLVKGRFKGFFIYNTPEEYLFEILSKNLATWNP